MKKNLALVIIMFCVVSILTPTMLTLGALASITPNLANATLKQGQYISEMKTVFLPGSIPKADVIFAFDTTSSMSGAISTMKAQAINIMNNLTSLISDAQYGVISNRDYPHTYNSYSYSGTYGSSTDYAYYLNQRITANRIDVSNAINSLLVKIAQKLHPANL